MLHNEQTKLREGLIVGMCNPLLDISAAADEQLLQKYDLLPNDAILAEEKHQPLYEELVDKFKVDYIAGGSGQNALRVAQWILNKPKVTVFMGCVGDDKYSKILESKAREDGVNVKYQVNSKEPTGTCAVILTGNGTNRSLCANLAAANHFTKDHIDLPENRAFVESAEFFYISGFFLTVSPESILDIGRYACSANKLFMMNLSAPFISQFFKDPLMQAFPYIDVLFGNDTEFKTFASEMKLTSAEGSVADIAHEVSKMPKDNSKRQRIVIVTQGNHPVILCNGDSVKEFPVDELPPERIVDTNGAGDAFVGGFLSQLAQGKDIEVCIKCGMWAASQIIQQDGCTFPSGVSVPAEYQS